MGVRQRGRFQEACTVSTVDEQVIIDRPVDEVYRLLSHEETDWLQPFLRLAAHKGERAGSDLRARLKPGLVAAPDGPRTIGVALGRPTVLVEDNAIEIPIRLATNGYRCVFPEFEGRALVSKSGDNKTSLSVLGAYREPTPITGGIDDSLVAQLAAQTTVRDLLENLCVAMETESSRNTLVEGSG
jgi:hypothetical protein